jgi:formylmethanofuran--tetrahydromethanopterin N-formyltransferase
MKSPRLSMAKGKPSQGTAVLIGSTQVVDTFAEAFRLRFVRLVVTAHDAHWLDAAVRATCGYGTSVIGCDAEIGVERHLPAAETPDGRPGAALLAFGFSAEGVGKAVANRTAQCLLTCPTASVFDGLPGASERAALGTHIRYFGDGFEKTKVIDGRRYWRVPVMDGEFLVEESVGIEKGVGGGNFILQGRSLEAAQQGGIAIPVAPGFDQRGILPIAGRPGADGARRGGGLCARDRDRWN